jgi:SAM-dependent methyltransferase
MLRVFREKHPGVALLKQSMDDLSHLPPESFDLVTAFNTAASYSHSLDGLIRSAQRILRPGGYLYFSVLARASLRRILRGKVGELESYRTRGDRKQRYAGAQARVYGRRHVLALIRRSQLELLLLDGQGALSGIVEFPWLWPISRLIDRVVPAIAHTYEVIARKAAPNG